MMKWLYLTDFSDNQTLYVNMARIDYFFRDSSDAYTRLMIIGGTPLDVEETPQEIMAMLEKAG